MYVLKIPKNKLIIIDILDKIMDGSTIHIPNDSISRKLGIYVKDWHKRGFIGIYNDRVLNDTVVKFNVKNIIKQKGKHVEYMIDETFLTTKIKI